MAYSLVAINELSARAVRFSIRYTARCLGHHTYTQYGSGNGISVPLHFGVYTYDEYHRLCPRNVFPVWQHGQACTQRRYRR